MPPRAGRLPRCIILAPTRELAKQVEREFQDSAPGLDVGCFYGGARAWLHGHNVNCIMSERHTDCTW